MGGRSSANGNISGVCGGGERQARLTADSSDVLLEIRVALAELAHKKLHLVD